MMMIVCLGGFTPVEEDSFNFDINDLYDYEKQFESVDIDVCSMSNVKTYMDYRMTTVRSSNQYKFLNYECKVDPKTGFLYDKDGFIAIALGSYYGVIGDRFYITLDTGIVLPVVKGEEKADVDTDWTGCYHTIDGSVMEFVIDSDYAYARFGGGNGLVLNGNYNNYSLTSGSIVRIEKVLDNKKSDLVSYQNNNQEPEYMDIYYYGSGF